MRPWLRRAWDVYERLFERVARIESVGDGMLRVRLIRYHGPDRRAGSERLRHGAPALEIHFRNDLSDGLHTGTAVRAAARLISGMRQALRQVAAAVDSNPRFADIEGLYAVSHMHRGSAHLGFVVELPPPGLGTRWLSAYMNWLMRLYGGADAAKSEGVRILWMSRAELLRRYGPTSPALVTKL